MSQGLSARVVQTAPPSFSPPVPKHLCGDSKAHWKMFFGGIPFGGFPGGGDDMPSRGGRSKEPVSRANRGHFKVSCRPPLGASPLWGSLHQETALGHTLHLPEGCGRSAWMQQEPRCLLPHGALSSRPGRQHEQALCHLPWRPPLSCWTPICTLLCLLPLLIAECPTFPSLSSSLSPGGHGGPLQAAGRQQGCL